VSRLGNLSKNTPGASLGTVLKYLMVPNLFFKIGYL
jgi:hypothetical protein